MNFKIRNINKLLYLIKKSFNDSFEQEIFNQIDYIIMQLDSNILVRIKI